MIRPARYLKTKEVSSRAPLLDYIERIQTKVDFTDYSKIAKKNRLLYLTLRTPELANMLWDIAEDIVGKFDFIPASRRNSGRNRIYNVKKWAKRSFLRDHLLSIVFDILATGEGYAYLGAKASKIREDINKVVNSSLIEKFYDEAVYNPLFTPISSVTVTNRHDESKLVGYAQMIDGNETLYSLREIIHLYFKRRAGKVDGFTPVCTMPLQLELLWLLWTNQYDLQAKGNMPDLIVTAKDIKVNSPALKDVEQKLKKYNMPGNSKHGTTLLYGSDYSFERMERDTGLQFEDVGKAVTSVLASAFRYPKHRLGIKTKESASDKDSQGNGDRDYWDMISKYQDKLADVLDTQIFEPYFGVQLVFDKSYKHDSVVENTAMRSRIDNVNLINDLLRVKGKQLSIDDTLSFIQGKNIDFDYEEIPEDEIPLASEFSLQGSIEKPKDEQLSMEKRQQQRNTETNNGGVVRQ